MNYKILTAEQAAELINHGDVVSFSGFTAAGCPKAVPTAIARRAEKKHSEGEPFKIGTYTGASTGESLDGELAKAKAISFRTPYQSSKYSREALNNGELSYYDMHLSVFAQYLRYGFLEKPKFCIVEACDLTDDGQIVPTSGLGNLPTFCRLADYIIVELNSAHPKELRGIHDMAELQDPPNRKAIDIYKPSDRCGLPYIKVEPSKIVGVVHTNLPSEVGAFTPLDEVTEKIGQNVSNFLAKEMEKGRIPKEFLPIQSGVGNIANAVMAALGANKNIPDFEMYTEVIQDSVIDLIKAGRVKFASGCSLTVSNQKLDEVYNNLEFFKEKIVIRPQEYSNNPEIARRLGLITINTALEADIFGNINSTHILGTKMMNGIGGSGDFTRSAYLSIFTTPSVAKKGAISAIVPQVSHVDHTEHSVDIIITEHGVADLRGKSPKERAKEIIENCVDPQYKDLLHRYLELAPKGHTQMNIENCFEMHKALKNTGDMRNAKFEKTL